MTYQYRAPVHRTLSPSELADAKAEYESRTAETKALLDYFTGRGNGQRVRFYNTAVKLLEREEQQFVSVQAELAADSKAA